MPEDISLLPKEVERKKEQEARERLWRRCTLVFLGVGLFLTAGVFIYSLTLNSQLSNLEQDITVERAKIASLTEMETEARDLEMRVGALAKIFDQKIYFSKLLQTLTQMVPADVAVVELTVPSEETISVSGTTRSYVSLAKFLLNLKANDLFSTVDLRSVSESNFDLSLGVAEGGLRK